MADLDHPPASDDPVVQNFLDVQWREAIRAAREGKEAVNKIWPQLVQNLPETAGSHLHRARDEFEAAERVLHRAGKFVLGQDAYDEYVENQTRRQIDS